MDINPVKHRFLMDETGKIIKYAIEGISQFSPVDEKTRTLVDYLKKNPESKNIINIK